LRRVAKARVHSDEEAKPTPVLREVIDRWHMAKEGKLHFDPKAWKKQMRK